MATKKMTKKVAKKLVKNHNRRVARANKAFEALTASEKRVAIARDVLAQLAVKRLVATNGVWLSGKNDSNLFTKADVKKNPELCDILKKQKSCEGCALGGMFMCAVEIADNLKLDKTTVVKEYHRDTKYYGEADAYLNGTIEGDDAFGYLRKFFSMAQLEKIEAAFERGGGSCSDINAEGFAADVEEPSDRMRLIMENIVVNRGTFRPDKQPAIRYVTPGFAG